MNILIPMAGPEEPFRERGFAYCKSLIEIDGEPLIRRVYDNLSIIDRERIIFVTRKQEDDRYHLGDVLRLLDPTSIVLHTEGQTAGAACTALLAIEYINTDEELLIANGDQFFVFDLRKALAEYRQRDLQAGTVVFDAIHPRWSYVRLNREGLIVEAAEKRPISRFATAGLYYFQRGRDFVDAAMEMIRKDAHVNGGFYVCPVFNEMILRQSKIGAVCRTQVVLCIFGFQKISRGSPNELRRSN